MFKLKLDYKEAFHKAYQVEVHLFKETRSFIRYYNYTEPQEGINYLTHQKCA
ncbi:MAG: hypothetical protein LBB87_00320 [Nitrososphaerota archaeon]|nr:hypothetical protein [Nitrososphaerota archaeon]